MRRDNVRTIVILLGLACSLSATLAVRAQAAFTAISNSRHFSASNYCIYPDSVEPAETPVPGGKKPFYISHYGRHGSRYLSNRKGYDIPVAILSRADSLGKLTATGQEVLQELRLILADSEGRWGDLTGLGKKQQRDIARRMIRHYPEVFEGAVHIDARSTTVPRCILSMGAATQQMVVMNPQLQVTLQASHRDMWYMNYQDQMLRSLVDSPSCKRAYDAFCKPRKRAPRLMGVLFNDTAYVNQHVDQAWLNYYLIKTAMVQQNTKMGERSQLINLFSYEEIHQFWQCENVWWYISCGPAPHSGGVQPYGQRFLLRKIISDADSCLRHKRPGAQLRFGHETVLLPLTCLLGINGYDTQIADLEHLEDSGWWACLVFPMASNIQLVFYRRNPHDKDVLVKVLLNERETRLPLPDDMAPYYRWSDFRQYYLKKLDAYEKQ